MRNICFYFKVTIPNRFKRYRFFEIGADHYYYDDFQNEEQLQHYVNYSLVPANKMIAEMIRSSNGKFKCSYAISGITIEQLEMGAPEVIDSFKELSQTGCVEFLSMPYIESLSSIYDEKEFEKQIKHQGDKIEKLFGKRPTTLFNSELIYSDEIGEMASRLGLKSVIIEEAKHVMGWKSPNFIYNHGYLPKLKLLVRNNKLSDDICFRFSNLFITSEEFSEWINAFPENEDTVSIGISYDVFGILQSQNTGIFEFMKALPYHAFEKKIGFSIPSEVTKKHDSAGALAVPYPMSWVGNDKNLTTWNGNDLQQEALHKLYSVGERVRLCQDKALQSDWLQLQSVHHFRYMSHHDSAGSPYESPYDAFINYMNILADFLERVDAQYPTTIENEELNELLKTIGNLEVENSKLQAEIKKLKAKK